ncbi:helix-turn-helix transcriptional regulator [Dactylosporangium roseum]|uniref:helix-turn-helix transcriptional regulator n=1 Tax=Dactylosporangium roseum TaxID=47989 RepID=UPI00338CC919
MPGFGYATVNEIVQIYGVAKSTVYKMASAEHWGRYRHPDGSVRYRREDVDKALCGMVPRQNARPSSKVRD